jgi:hypothetical protein
MSSLAQLSATLTVLGALAWLRPPAIAAQGIGTMQVTAEVVRAEPAWTGLQAAQEAARILATAPSSSQAIDLDLSRITVAAPSPLPHPASGSFPSPDARPVAVVIQYLRN